MAGTRIYLDYNATAPLVGAAADAMSDAMALTGNPSSVHAEGRKMRALVEQARRDVAALIGAPAEGVVFTGSGTEANNLALVQAKVLGCTAILYGAGEHASVLGAVAASDLPALALALRPDGRIDIDALEAALAKAGDKPFVMLQYANNETGVVQPLARVAQLVRGQGGIIASDAVQGTGKADIRLDGMGVHMAALSAHKIGGPQGVGALVLADDMEMTPLVHGGGQERRRRGGTENVTGIAGFAAAARAAADRLCELDAQAARRDAFEARLRALAPEVEIFGRQGERLANTSCFALEGTPAETLLMKLDLAGFAVSSGAACSSGKVMASHVLEAMGVKDTLSRSAIRMSCGPDSTEENLMALAGAWAQASGVESEKQAGAGKAGLAISQAS